MKLKRLVVFSFLSLLLCSCGGNNLIKVNEKYYLLPHYSGESVNISPTTSEYYLFTNDVIKYHTYNYSGENIICAFYKTSQNLLSGSQFWYEIYYGKTKEQSSEPYLFRIPDKSTVEYSCTSFLIGDGILYEGLDSSSNRQNVYATLSVIQNLGLKTENK